MPQPSRRSPLLPFALIALVVGGGAAAFAYTGGWLSPDRLTPTKLVDSLAPPTGAAAGRRRNHAKGICFTGTFAANGNGSELSTAQMLAKGEYPVVGRFNLATPNPMEEDGAARVRGLGLKIATPDGREWRSAMITAPFFPVATVDAFYALQQASGSKDGAAMPAFAATHPELAAFGTWAKSAPWNGSYAEDRFNGLNSFVFTNASGQDATVRWSFVPVAQPVAVSPDELKKRGPDTLEREITERIGKGPATWTMVVQVANTGDPTADPSKVWPEDRRKVEVGALTVRTIVPEPDGPCRDVNFDPTVLPSGMRTSDDPFPAARSAAYRISFDRRSSESAAYPATGGAKP